MATLSNAIVKVLRGYSDAGTRQKVQRLCPVDTGALRQSVRMRVLERHGAVVFRAELLGYVNFQRARGVNKHLVPTIGDLLGQTLRRAVIQGSQIYLLQQLAAWNLPRQEAFFGSLPGSIRLQFRFFLINDGRTR